jgi:MFS family permease
MGSGGVEKAPGLAAKLRRGAAHWIEPWKSRDFRWVWFTRFLNALGFYIILSYLPNYLEDTIRVFRLPGLTLTEPFQATILMSLILSLSGAVSAVYGGRLADRWGRKRVIYASGWIMFATLVPFSLIRNYAAIVFLAPFFGIGYGAYLSATWALASDILPAKEDAAKDMGIWQMSVAAPQVVAGFLVGLMITLGNRQSAGMGYTLAFLFASFSFLIGSLLVKRVRGST